MFSVSAPFGQFFNLSGDPLDSGYVYIGQPNQNPETNPVAIYWDNAGTMQAPNPIRTLNGYITRIGTPANVYVNGDFSMTVRDKNGVLVYTVPSGFDSQISSLISVLTDGSTASNGAGYVGFSETTQYTTNIGLALRRRAQIVNSVAELRLLSKLSTPCAIVTGYYTAGDGGGTGLVIYDPTDTLSADNGVTIFVASDGGRWKMANREIITTKQAGAKADGVTDDSAAITRWVNAGFSIGCKMLVSNGIHQLNSAQIWNFSSVPSGGITIDGCGNLNSVLRFGSVGTRPLQFQGSTTGGFIGNFKIQSAADGPTLTIGKDDYSDTFSGYEWDLFVVNTGLTSNVEGCRFNTVTQSTGNLIAMGGGSGAPGQPTTPGFGKCIVMRNASYNTMNLTGTMANIGLYYTGGTSIGNIFTINRLSDVQKTVVCDVTTVSKNFHMGGILAGSTIFTFGTGASSATNVFKNPVIQIYAGGTLTAGVQGLMIDIDGGPGSLAPATPATNPGNFVQNLSGFKQTVYLYVNTTVAAAGTNVTIQSASGTPNITNFYSLSIGGSSAGSATIPYFLNPMDSIRATNVGGSSYTWFWVPT